MKVLQIFLKYYQNTILMILKVIYELVKKNYSLYIIYNDKLNVLFLLYILKYYYF